MTSFHTSADLTGTAGSPGQMVQGDPSWVENIKKWKKVQKMACSGRDELLESRLNVAATAEAARGATARLSA